MKIRNEMEKWTNELEVSVDRPRSAFRWDSRDPSSVSELISFIDPRVFRDRPNRFLFRFPRRSLRSVSETLFERVYCSLSLGNNPQGRDKDAASA